MYNKGMRSMYSSETTFIYGKRKDKKKKVNTKFFFIIFLFLLIVAIIVFINSPISRIDEIEITGISLLTEEEIFEKANIYYDMKYFFALKSKIKDDLLELEVVKEVEVIKIFPGKLSINIVEFKPLAYLYYKPDWIPILEDGLVYNKLNNNDFLEHPLVTNWQDMSQINKLAEELNNTKSSVLVEISEIQQNPQENNPNQLLIFTRDGYRLHLVLEDFSKKLNLYPEIIENLKTKSTKTGDIYLFDSIRFEEYSLID